MERKEKLNIVDKQGNIIGEDTRENIHKKGLLHREIHVWFYTPRGKIIFQHRGKDQETYPDLLDATVGGHIELNKSYEETALEEIREETGITTTIDNLKLIKTMKRKSYDSVTDRINNVIRAVYAYQYDGKVEDLKVEQGKGLGFEVWPLKKILNLPEEEKKKFIPAIFSEEFLEIFRKIQSLIK